VIDLFGRKKYYVSFIDDYSKFTWVYLLRQKYDVFKFSLNSNLLLSVGLIRRLSPCSLIGVGNMSISIPISVSLALLTKSPAPTLTNKAVLPSGSIVILSR
jgi:hypothetical protein